MSFQIRFTPTGAKQLRAYRKYEQGVILDGIEAQLTHEPLIESRNRKRLGENELADWELRIGDHRVFYDVALEDGQQIVQVKAVGHKKHDRLYVGGHEVRL